MQQSQEPEITTGMTVGLAALGSFVGGGLATWLITWASNILDLDNPASAAKDFQGLLGTVGVAGVVIALAGGCWLALRTRKHPRAIHIAVATPMLVGLMLLLVVSIGPDQPNSLTLLGLFGLGGGLAAVTIGRQPGSPTTQ